MSAIWRVHKHKQHYLSIYFTGNNYFILRQSCTSITMAARINILVMTGSFVKGFFIRYDLENLLGYMALFSTYNQHSQAGDKCLNFK